MIDPVAAYDRIAPVYARLSAQRRAYLDAVERLIVAGIPADSRSILDVGTGDGTRAMRIAQAAGLERIVLLEPSARMRRSCPPAATMWAMRAEDLSRCQGSFDVVTCLWNVLGHILPSGARVEALSQFARLVAPAGRIFIDVNHRYNARHYGILPTAVRFVRDRIGPAGSHGDVRVAWDLAGHRAVTTGHVFTHPEFVRLCRAAGLNISQRFVVDYASGEIRRCSFEGHLLYVLQR